jgi:hypothetical protein
MQYVNKKNGKKAKLLSKDDKYKTVVLEVQDGNETRAISITTSTLKKWWRVLHADGTVEPDPPPPPKPPAKPKGRPKKEKPPQEPKTPRNKIVNPQVASIAHYVKQIAELNGGTYYVREKQPNRTNYKFEQVDSDVRLMTLEQNQTVIIFFRSRYLPEDMAKEFASVNQSLDKKYTAHELNPETKKTIEKIIKAVASNNTSKNQ